MKSSKMDKLRNFIIIVSLNIFVLVILGVFFELASYFYFTKTNNVHVINEKVNEFPSYLANMTIAKYRMYRTHREYHSENYNVDKNWFRSFKEVDDIFKDYDSSFFNIFCIGGSTTFGHGVKDKETWPYYLLKLLSDEGFDNLRIYNLGQGGFNLHEEIYLILDQLKQGRIPNLVIFFDGTNQKFCPEHNDRYKAYRDLLDERSCVKSLWESTYSYKMVDKIKHRFVKFISSKQIKSTNKRNININTENYKKCALTYVNDCIFIKTILERFGSTMVVFLQPNGTFIPDRTVYKFWSYGYPTEDLYNHYTKLYNDILTVAADKNFTLIYDIRNVLNDLSKKRDDLFFDWAHLNGPGNEYMSKAIKEKIKIFIPKVGNEVENNR